MLCSLFLASVPKNQFYDSVLRIKAAFLVKSFPQFFGDNSFLNFGTRVLQQFVPIIPRDYLIISPNRVTLNP
jgi:hypothetical protein